jgi:predicted ABC-type exoprotein transport system permease subunit
LGDDPSSDSNYHSRQNVLEILDGFIESMTKMRKLFVGFSASALFLAPIAIVLVIYLIFHPLFSSVLENYGDFGILLSILLGSVIIISGTWFVLGLKQYRIISSWNKRHIQYTRIKEDMQKAFASQFEIEEP